MARRAGVNVVIATGQMPEVVGRLAKGERIGTLFPALASPLEGRKSWILAGPPPRRSAGGSGRRGRHAGEGLQPAAQGYSGGEGRFRAWRRGAHSRSQGAELARGICRYNHLELDKLRGVHSDNIEQVLGYGYGAVAIHRDDMVLL